MIKIADWVTTATGGRGIVTRVAKDGTWADVKWRQGDREWSKRMTQDSLIVLTTIQIGDWTVTDVTREKELREVTR